MEQKESKDIKRRNCTAFPGQVQFRLFAFILLLLDVLLSQFYQLFYVFQTNLSIGSHSIRNH